MFARTVAIVAFAFGAGALLMIAQRRRADSATSWQKYGTYAVFVLLMLGAAFAGRVVFALAVSIVLGAALFEFFQAAGMTNGTALALTVAGLAIAAVAFSGGQAALYPTVVTLVLVTLSLAAFSANPQNGAVSAVWGVVGLVAVAAPGAHLLLLAGHLDRFALFAFLFLVVCGADAFAELAGRRWPVGRGILRASPNKTVGGLLGGLTGAVALALLLSSALGLWPPLKAAAYGLVTALAGIVGDLIASSMKRALGIKDFGALLAQHGGVLDRFDSLIFAAAPFYWLTGG